MAVQPLNVSHLRGIAEVLGDTDQGLTNREIQELLAEAGIDDPTPEPPPGHYVRLSKRDRLFNALQKRQAEDRSAAAVIRCIELAMQPVRYADKEDLFSERQAELSQRLMHVGLKIDDRGRIVPTQRATTASEARTRTKRLRATLEDRRAHPKVLAACHREIKDENYFHIVLEAVKSLAEEIRQVTGLDADGTTLVNEAFEYKRGELPRLAWNKLETETDRSEHRGLTNLCRGVVGAFRNPTAHELKIRWDVSEQDALDVCSMLSLLHRRLENATPIPEELRNF